MDEIDFGALLCARLCHDLISPVSAARNGIAMAIEEKDGAMRAEAMDLTAEGLADAVDKLRVYRIAYGNPGPATTLAEARKAARGLYSRGRVQIEWSEEGGDPGPEQVRLLTNLVLLGAESVARGGVVRVAPPGAALTVTANGGRAALASDILAVIEGAPLEEPMTARQIQAALTCALVRRIGGTLRHESGEGVVSLAVALS